MLLANAKTMNHSNCRIRERILDLPSGKDIRSTRLHFTPNFSQILRRIFSNSCGPRLSFVSIGAVNFFLHGHWQAAGSHPRVEFVFCAPRTRRHKINLTCNSSNCRRKGTSSCFSRRKGRTDFYPGHDTVRHF
jgi:hypothetical protein